MGKFVQYVTGTNNPSVTATSFDVTVTFPSPQNTFVIEGFDFDGANAESIRNFSIPPTSLSSNAQIVNGEVKSTGTDQDVVLTWNLPVAVTQLTFTIARAAINWQMSFNVGFLGLCDTDGEGKQNHVDKDLSLIHI